MKIDGGPAYPTIKEELVAHGINREWEKVHYPGMSLRDYFAGQALGVLTALNPGTPEAYANMAYQLADAMLAEREKEK